MRANYLILVILTALSAGAVFSAETEYDVLAVTPASETSYLAVRVPMSEDLALAGLRWYNSDSAVPFTDLSLAMADDDGVPMLSGAMPVAGETYGLEKDWSDLTFEEAVLSNVGDLFFVFHFPPVAGGAPGEGPGIGYEIGVGGLKAWISGDGGAWTPMHGTIHLKVEPVYDTNKGLGGAVTFEAPELITYTTALAAPQPNPFNPKTKLSFTLRSAGHAELVVFDLRGARVRTLVAGTLDVGRHEVSWLGVDDHGRSVASGVYFARLVSVDGFHTRRLVLVR
mgnify:CR=1 FL=1